MNNKNILYEQEENKIPSDEPLSSEELSRLIKASKDKSFNSIKIKKEVDEGFKKVSLHDIAKQAKEQKKIVKEDNENQLEKELTNTQEKQETEISENNENKKTNDKLKEEIQEEKEINEDSSKEDVNEKVDKAFHLEELENTKKVAFEEGREKAFSEIKEGSEAAIATLKKISEALTKVDNEDLKKLEQQISEKILEFASDLSGTIIKALPSDYTKKIKSYISSLENIEGASRVYINEEDYKVIEKNKEVKKEIKNLNIFPETYLKNGEFEIKINGVTIAKKMTIIK